MRRRFASGCTLCMQQELMRRSLSSVRSTIPCAKKGRSWRFWQVYSMRRFIGSLRELGGLIRSGNGTIQVYTERNHAKPDFTPTNRAGILKRTGVGGIGCSLKIWSGCVRSKPVASTPYSLFFTRKPKKGRRDHVYGVRFISFFIHKQASYLFIFRIYPAFFLADRTFDGMNRSWKQAIHVRDE